MTKLITVEVPEEQEAAFWQAVHPLGITSANHQAWGKEDDALVAEIMRRRADPQLSQTITLEVFAAKHARKRL